MSSYLWNLESCYCYAMKREATALLEAFENLPADEKRALAEEILRRSLPFDSGPLEDAEIAAASASLLQSLGEARCRIRSAVSSG